jgi:hypothetical protein
MPPPLGHSVQRSLEYISGYLALNMIADAQAELAKIEEAERLRPEVVEAEMSVLYAAEAWPKLERVARRCTLDHPGLLQGWLSLAFAVRRTTGVGPAQDILVTAELRFGTATALLEYNLACYLCLQGELPASLERLNRAFQLDAHFRAVAREDEDLRALWPVIDAG